MLLANQLVTLGRKWVHPQTNWIHYHPHTKWGQTHVAIPTYENLLFVLALFETKNSQNFLEGKERLEKILAYTNIPKYLHEWPSEYAHWRLEAPFAMIKERWSEFLGPLIDRFPSYEIPSLPKDKLSLESLIHVKNWELIQKHWSPALARYLGPENQSKQDGIYPELTPLDGILRYHLYEPKIPEEATPEWLNLILLPEISLEVEDKPALLHWGDANNCHTLFSPKGKWENNNLIHEFDKPYEPVEEEVNLYINRQEGSVITVNGSRSTTFNTKDVVEIETPSKKFQVKFAVSGGDFLGHITLGNRPSQIRDDLEAYDWIISLRTLRRETSCRVICKLGL